jgi:hypothetical protein
MLTFAFNPSGTWTGTAPAGSVTATFTDVAGGVQLVINSNLGPNENLDPQSQGAIFFNFNPAKSSELTHLTFALTANTGFSQVATANQGEDAYNADGGGAYDILLSYTSSTKAFTTGESQTYLITTSVGTVTVADFDFLASPQGGNGPFEAAIHVQNTPNGGSGSAYVAPDVHRGPNVGLVPAPPSVILLGLGAGGLTSVNFLRRRRLPAAA